MWRARGARATQKQESAAPGSGPWPVGSNPYKGAGRAIRHERRFTLSIGKFCRLLKDFHKHFSRQLAGLRVLIRRMIRREQHLTVG